jgi:tetratricopeptide (TPR) repeat protein
LRRDWTKALDAAKQSIHINPNSVLQRSNYGFYLTYASQFAEALKVQKAILQENSSFVKGYVGVAVAEMGQGHISEAMAAWQQLATINAEGASRAALGLADIALYEARLNDAIGILEKAIPVDISAKNPDFAALKLVTLAYAQALTGQAGPARTTVEKALAASQDTGVQFWAARDYLEMGNEAKALALAQQLGNNIGAEQRADTKLIEGEALLKRGRPRDAIQRFRDSQKILDTWLAHFDLARAYIEAGAFAEADSETEICIKRRGETTSAFLDEEPTSYLFPSVYYYHGRAQEGLNSAEAPESYKQFLAVEQNGQGRLAADARRRLGNFRK